MLLRHLVHKFGHLFPKIGPYSITYLLDDLRLVERLLLRVRLRLLHLLILLHWLLLMSWEAETLTVCWHHTWHWWAEIVNMSCLWEPITDKAILRLTELVCGLNLLLIDRGRWHELWVEARRRWTADLHTW